MKRDNGQDLAASFIRPRPWVAPAGDIAEAGRHALGVVPGVSLASAECTSYGGLIWSLVLCWRVGASAGGYAFCKNFVWLDMKYIKGKAEKFQSLDLRVVNEPGLHLVASMAVGNSSAVGTVEHSHRPGILGRK